MGNAVALCKFVPQYLIAMQHYHAVIMAGGVGSRFWPMSRKDLPKQFLDILGTGETLLQATYRRMAMVCPEENIWVVTNDDYAHLVAEQLPQLSSTCILAEPARKNTAPCAAFAAYRIHHTDPNACLVVAAADHLILREDAFAQILKEGLDFVDQQPMLLTLGVKPHRPDTGYGYIQFEPKPEPQHPKVRKVKTFTEKPNRELAETFLSTGEFFWNSGNFIWKASDFIQAFQQYLPEEAALFQEMETVWETPKAKDKLRQVYTMVRNISVDYGIMEKATNVAMLMADFGWSDLGTWGSLYEQLPKDDHQNAIAGQPILVYDSKDCMIHMQGKRLVVLQGLSDMIVAESENMLLICRKQDEQEIKNYLNDIKLSLGDKFL